MINKKKQDKKNLTEKTTTLLHLRHQIQLTTTYSYDSTNLLTKITYPDGRENEFINCTCGDKRISKQDSTGTYSYFFDNYQGIEHVIIEYDENNQMKARYTLGPRTDEIISKYYRDKHGKWRKMYYHYDALGNVRVLTDEKGRIKGRYEYSPFGYPLIQQGKLTRYNNYTYTGREQDRDSRFYYYRTRYYNSQIGRFIEVDPILREVKNKRRSMSALFDFSQRSYNVKNLTKLPSLTISIPLLKELEEPYIYGKNNPIKYKDPSGKVCNICVKVFNIHSTNPHVWISFPPDPRDPDITSAGFYPLEPVLSFLGDVEAPDPKDGMMPDFIAVTQFKDEGYLENDERNMCCTAAGCRAIQKCLQKHIYDWKLHIYIYGFIDCRDYVSYLLDMCCLKSFPAPGLIVFWGTE